MSSAAVAAGLAFTVTLRARSGPRRSCAPRPCSPCSRTRPGGSSSGAAAGVFVAALAVGARRRAGGDAPAPLAARLHRPGHPDARAGSAGFNSVLQLLTGQTVSGIDAGFDTFVTAMSIAYGLIVSSVVLPAASQGSAHHPHGTMPAASPRGTFDSWPTMTRVGRGRRACSTRCCPIVVLIGLLALTIALFGIDATDGPLQVALLLSAAFASLIAFKNGYTVGRRSPTRPSAA